MNTGSRPGRRRGRGSARKTSRQATETCRRGLTLARNPPESCPRVCLPEAGLEFPEIGRGVRKVAQVGVAIGRGGTEACELVRVEIQPVGKGELFEVCEPRGGSDRAPRVARSWPSRARADRPSNTRPCRRSPGPRCQVP